MAIFIPENPHSSNSQGENRALRLLESLSDDWYVFHSVNWVAPQNYKKAVQGEIDILVFNPKLGMLVLEVKGGTIGAENGSFFSLGKNGAKNLIKNPMQQAADNKHALRQHLFGRLDKKLVDKIAIGHAVWFPDCASVDPKLLPLDWKVQWTLFQDACYSPEGALTAALYEWQEQIFHKRNLPSSVLTDEEVAGVVQAIAPRFDALPVHGVDVKLREMRFIRLTENQNRILDYLEDADFLAIYGSAGTGKTLLAVEMCRRLAEAGQKTLFLCYNALLKKRVEDRRNSLAPELQALWDVYTFDGLAISLCKIFVAPQSNKEVWDAVKLKLLQHLKSGESFPYVNVVVDEAQDFDEEWLKILRKRSLGKFVVFYDPKQLVYDSRSSLANFLNQAEVKLKLPYNMRNTLEIARTGYGFAQIEPKTLAPISGPIPKFFVYSDEKARLDKVREILGFWHDVYGPENVMVCLLGQKPANYKLRAYEFPDGSLPQIDTALRLKGLEAKAALLPEADLTKLKTVPQRNKFYVASTRARHELAVFVKRPDADVLRELYKIYKIEPNGDFRHFFKLFGGECVVLP
ncbi:MAG: NERD domain-containing protein [Bacteroidia bacterium]|nr:NERD domain-containing protein [Bacteroidia bacterium]